MSWSCVQCGEPRDLADFGVKCGCGGYAVETAAAVGDSLGGMEVVVTTHALKRYRERHPDRAKKGVEILVIHRDVREAIEAGRRSSNRPRWATLDGRQRTKLGRSIRFVWTADEAVAYIVRKKADRWHVITTLSRSVSTGERLGVDVRRTIFDQLTREGR